MCASRGKTACGQNCLVKFSSDLRKFYFLLTSSYHSLKESKVVGKPIKYPVKYAPDLKQKESLLIKLITMGSLAYMYLK